MPSYSSWDVASKPFVEGFFVLPKAIGRAAIRDGLALEDEHQSRSHLPTADRRDPEKKHSALVSLSVQ